jgi:nucleotide-binding universal stress UspA family protein
MAHDLSSGSTIDQFTLEREVHRGGMASLWLASAPGEPAPVLLKMPFLGEGEDVSGIIGFEAEQMFLPRLSGPHVPRFVASGGDLRRPYLAMEYVPGQSLEERRQAGKLPLGEVLRIGQAVATALQDIHGQHVVHLDVKPANILLRPDGTPVLIDFGLSRHDELPDLLGEESDLPIGTGAYIAPEQILGHRGDPRSDVFALGVILYELVTGELPFGNPQREAGMRKRLWRDPVPPRVLAPECPPWLQEVITRCLEVHPDKRYGTAAQLAFALEHPEQVTLTERATRVTRAGFWATLRRWWGSRDLQLITRQRVAEILAGAPIVVVAVDLSQSQQALAEALRTQAARLMETMPQSRLACVTVLKTALIAIDTTVDEGGTNVFLQRLIELKAWAHPLALPEDRVSFHVLEAVSPADALIDYARHNRADHVLVGARANSTLRRYLGSVSAQVVAEAPCSVTVVRLREPQLSAQAASA